MTKLFFNCNFGYTCVKWLLWSQKSHIHVLKWLITIGTPDFSKASSQFCKKSYDLVNQSYDLDDDPSLSSFIR